MRSSRLLGAGDLALQDYQHQILTFEMDVAEFWRETGHQVEQGLLALSLRLETFAIHTGRHMLKNLNYTCPLTLKNHS